MDLGLVTPNSTSGTATPQHNPLTIVDTDGDGTVDRNDLDFALAASDSLDVDGDGVPNSLDPNYLASADDSDGDGIPNARDLDIDNDGLQNADDDDADGVGGADSIQTLLQRAYAQTAALNLQGAYQSFRDIVDEQPDHQLGNIGLAVTRIGAVLTDLNPGTDPAKLETMKEILDRAGVSQEGRDLANFTASPPRISRTITVDYGGGYTYSYDVSCTVFPANTPTPHELRAYLNERLRPQIEAALDNLDTITPDFRFTQPIVVAGTSVSGEMDYGDVLALKAALRGALAFLTLLNAYDLEFDLDELHNNTNCDQVDPSTYQPIPAQTFVERYPDLGKLTHVSALINLKALATAAVDDAIAAMDSIHGEAEDQNDDLVTVDPTTFSQDRELLVKIKATFDGPVNWAPLSQTSLDVIDASRLFSGVNLRNYVPAFMGSSVVYESIRSASYDPTIGGLFPNLSREEIVRFVDPVSPNVTFVDLLDHMSNPIAFGVRVDDTEILPDNTTQVGAGVDPTSFSLHWYCWPEAAPYPYPGCTLTGEDENGTVITTPSNWANITELFGAAGPDANGVYIWTPHGGSLTVDSGGAASVNNVVWVEVQDRSGNFQWYAQESFAVP